MNAFAVADQFPVISLIRGSVKQPWIPDERSGHSPPIDEMNCELVVSHLDLHGARFRLNASEIRHDADSCTESCLVTPR